MAVSVLFQDQLSADMYSFVAKEIDYANYFQAVSVFEKIICIFYVFYYLIINQFLSISHLF